ncbi:MAG: pyridoxal-phosphate dependent enzyme [Acidimicrobiales bacterium]|nr:pyridoxal-phosphate dependent enzyme [Acidimicrobiales bacterium]
MPDSPTITLGDITAAQARIAGTVDRTPLVRATSLGQAIGCELWLKCENLQVARAFKARGAHNAVFALDDAAAANGVATHSSGNHGAALALAASRRSIPAHIVVPADANPTKRALIESFGAHIVLCEPTLEARESRLAEVVADTGARFVHPYEDPLVMAGQGTVGLEILEELSPDVVVVPLGGGGLLAGIAVACDALAPSTQVLGAEPAGAADGLAGFTSGQRVASHTPHTVADGLRTTVGRPNFELIRGLVDGILVADDDEILAAVAGLEAATGGPVEPSGAVAVAAIARSPERFAGRTVVAVITGGNVAG